jgi:hypothetical protein
MKQVLDIQRLFHAQSLSKQRQGEKNRGLRAGQAELPTKLSTAAVDESGRFLMRRGYGCPNRWTAPRNTP